MGERQNGNGTPGRRPVHPTSGSATPVHPASGSAVPGHLAVGATGAGAPGPRSVRDVEAVLVAALAGGAVDAEGERRALEAFRAARDAGARRAARTRTRDDWRPRERGRAARSLKVTLSAAVAGLTLGGAAFAAIGSAGSGESGAGGGPGHLRTSTSASVQPGTSRNSLDPPSSTASSGPSSSADGPVTAAETRAHCQAYEQVGERGKALDATAWQRLVTAAGGATKVRAYCAGLSTGEADEAGKDQSGKPSDEGRPSTAGEPSATGRPSHAARPTDAGQSGATGRSGDEGRSGSTGSGAASGKGQGAGESTGKNN